MSGSFRIERRTGRPDARRIPSSSDRGTCSTTTWSFILLRPACAARRASSSTIPDASASCCLPDAPDEHPMLAGLGVEPTGNALDGDAAGRPVSRQEGAVEGGSARPAADSRARQHICLGGAVARRPLAAPRSRHDRRRRPAGLSSAPSRLATAIRSVIADAIEAGGSSLRDHARRTGARLFPAFVFGL